MASFLLRTARTILAALIVCALISSLFLTRWGRSGEGALFPPVHGDGEKAPDVVVLSLYPSDSVVVEGDSFQVTCLATGTDEVFFELPKISQDLKSSVQTRMREGGATLLFPHVELGHQAKYTCTAVGRNGVKKRSVVDMVVRPREEAYDAGVMEEVEEEEGWGREEKEERERGQEGEKEKEDLDQRGKMGGREERVRGERERRGDERERGEEEKRSQVERGRGERRVGEVDMISDGVRGDPKSIDFAVPIFESMEDRAKYQREQVDAFCKRHDLDILKYQLPISQSQRGNKDNKVYMYNRHLLLDDKHKILFCFVPKVGCTNLKLVVFVSQGIIPRSQLTKARDEVDQRALEGAMFRNSFISIQDVHHKQNALQSYYKYTMFRHPLERLASSFRSKVERFPLHGLRADQPHFNWLRKDIYSSQHRDKYEAWKADNNGNTPINISFADFVEYWANNPIVNKIDGYLDEHFLTITEMCQPCRTRFDFYGNFQHFERDAQVLIDKVGASMSDLRQGYYSEDTSTDQRMKLYYSTLSDTQKRAVLRKLALELEFHYSIFPEERGSHKQILGLDEELPLT